ncbi:MAG: Para-hydroxybenzoate--polyprenyltransferase, mitochondrial precursor (PHB:polyprenyltransferase) [Geoglossum umbratile]|nr:MAG: Para-hydroxybenzoate--polyprenyltransferase, mitochondrial precursor (PHB:polyprenyltransferase) [Geoglossum umbratile]
MALVLRLRARARPALQLSCSAVNFPVYRGVLHCLPAISTRFQLRRFISGTGSGSRFRPTDRGRPRKNTANQCLTRRQEAITLSPQPRRAAVSTHSSAISVDAPSPSLEKYSPPTSGLLSRLPASWVPYAELIRLDKPTGTYYLFWPCAWSTLLAAALATPTTPVSTVIYITGLFATGALVMRGAGCSINDLWDRNLDPHVARTKFRPIARRAITPERAIVFTGAQLLTGLAVLLQFPTQCLYFGIPSLALVATYPLAKRVTHYPHAVLGLAFSWGALMGFPALGIDLLSPGNSAALTAAGLLYTSNVAWTILYDIIYAHMDIRDDLKAGIKSTVVAHEKHTKKILTGLAIAQLALLSGAGIAAGCGPVFFVGSVGSASASLAWMIQRVKLDDVKDCWWWFRYGCWFTGGGVTAGLVGEYFTRTFDVYGEEGSRPGEIE